MQINIRDRWLWLAVLSIVVAAVYAGTTNFQTLALTPEVSSDNALVVNDSSGTNKFVINGSGNIATMSGTVALSGASTVTADMTFSGDGIDLLFNAANQNTIGGATKGAKAVYTRAVTGENSTALTLSGDTGISIASNMAIANNIDITVTDGNTELGTEAASLGGGYFKTLDADTSINTDGTLGVTGVATFSGGALLATGQDLLGAVDGTSDVGSATFRMGAIHTDSIFVSPVVAIAATSRSVLSTETFVQATGAGAEVDITFPNATTSTGRLLCVIVKDTTTNDVNVKVDTSGKLGTSAAPDGANGVAGATGVTASADGSCGCWVSNGTDYDLVVVGGGTWATSS